MKQLIRRAALGTLGIGILATGMLATAPAIAAKGSDVVRHRQLLDEQRLEAQGQPDNGRLEVEFEVDQNRNGQTWNVSLKHNGNAFFTGQRTTQAPSGSFSVPQLTSNARGHRHDRRPGRQPQDRRGLPGHGQLLSRSHSPLTRTRPTPRGRVFFVRGYGLACRRSPAGRRRRPISGPRSA